MEQERQSASTLLELATKPSGVTKPKKRRKISKNNAETFTTKKHRKPSGSQDGRSPLAPTQEGRQAGGLCSTAGSGSILTSHGSSNQNNGSH